MSKLRIVTIGVCLLLLGGCAGQRVYEEGRLLVDAGRVEEGLAKLEEAVKLEPENRAYRQAVIRSRELGVSQWLAQADALRMQGRFPDAQALYERVLKLDPRSDRANVGMTQVDNALKARKHIADAQRAIETNNVELAYQLTREGLTLSPGLAEARTLLRRIEEMSARAQPAALQAAFRKPVSMEFRGAPLRMVFDLLSRSSGLNFLFDREVKPDQVVTISVTDTSVEEIMRFILLTSQLAHRVLNDRTVLVYPATPAKMREYQELYVRTFFLGTADAKSAVNLIRQVVKSKEVFVDEKLNMLVIRDTEDAIRMAEKLLANQDRAEPEVMLELEVLEVARNDLSDLGARFPDQINFSIVGSSGTAGQLTLREWLNRDSSLVRLSFTNPSLILNFRSQLSRSNLLANPRIRVRNKEKAKIHIGDRVPVITTTATSTGFVSEAVNYVDVGLKLDVEPVVHIEEEVGIRVALEVSNIVDQTRTQSGTLAYRIGTRNASTVLRLKDGETQVLAGLISDEDRSSANRVPGLGQIPAVGRLFGSQLDQSSKTEIMLLVTPRVIRPLAQPSIADLTFASGTEAQTGVRPFAVARDASSSARQSSAAGVRPAVSVSTGAPSNASQPIGSAPAPATGAAAITPSASAVPAPPTSLAYLSTTERAKNGDTISVALSISGQTPLKEIAAQMNFDPLHFKFVDMQPGPLVNSSTGKSGVSVEKAAGDGTLAFKLEMPVGMPTTGTLAVIRLQVVGASGRSAIRLERFSPMDLAGKPVNVGLGTPQLITITK